MRQLIRWLAVLFASLCFASPALTQAQTFVPRFGDTSWPNSFVAAETDRPGADFLAFDLPRGEAEGAKVCAMACAQNKQCQAYTYVKPGIQNPDGRCYLKSSAPPAQSNACCVSGARTPDQVVAYPAIANPFGRDETRRRVGFAKFPASGVIPVAIVIFDFGNGFPRDDSGFTYDAAYFEALTFAPPAQNAAEIARNQPLQLPNGAMFQSSRRTSEYSLSSYYWEASNHKLLLVPAGGVIGPLPLAPGPAGDSSYTARKAAEQVARTYGDRLRLFDQDGDGRLIPSEFAIMVYDNGSTNGAAARSTGSDCIRPAGSPVDLCVSVGLHGYRSGAQNPAHEFMHLLGIHYDTYGWDFRNGSGSCWGLGATILSCTAFQANDTNRRLTVDFDAYHRIAFGWASPQLLRIGSAGIFKLTPAQSLEDRPLLLYKPDWSEIYVIEYRNGQLGGHDAGFFRGMAGFSPPKGVMVWYAQLGDNGLIERPAAIGPGGDGRFQSTPANDDVMYDYEPTDANGNPTPDGVTDSIGPGPNATLDTVRAGDDEVRTTAMVFPSRNPRNLWTSTGSDPAVPVGTNDLRLWDWAGNRLPLRIEIQPHPTERDAVLVFVYAEP